MTYVSVEWLGWLAGTTALFWACPARLRFQALALITLVFLVVKSPPSALVLLLLTLLTATLTRGTRLEGRQTLIALAPAAASLVFFKLLSSAESEDLLRGTLIPLGLSFYTLRCMHYVLERYMGRIEQKPLPDLAEYLFFLPTIFIGPIHRYPAFDRERRRHRWDAGLFSDGLERILYGYVKITVIGNFLIAQVYLDWVPGAAEPATSLDAYLAMLGIGFGLYMQFSGASDVAIGFARLLGIRVMENFDWPFLSTSLPQFWQRWHISLTSWAREYVFAGVTSLTRSPALSAIATMVVIGLWHEMSLRYLLWGLYHGLGIAVWQRVARRWPPAPQEPAALGVLRRVFGWLLTLHFVMLGFLLVRQPDLASMLGVLRLLVMGG